MTKPCPSCTARHVPIAPQLRVVPENVWGQDWWTVEVTVLLGHGLVWFIKQVRRLSVRLSVRLLPRRLQPCINS